MNRHLSDLKLIATLHGRFTEGRLISLGITKSAIRAAITSRLLSEASGVLTSIPVFRRAERLRSAGLIEGVDQAAMDKANYVRRIVDGKPVLMRVVSRQNGKLMVPDPANPQRNIEVDPNDVAPVSDEDAEKEQKLTKAGQPVPGQTPVTESGVEHIAVGDTVRHAATGAIGTVLTVGPAMAWVQFPGSQEEVKLTKLIKTGREPNEDDNHRPNCGFFAGAACTCGGRAPLRRPVKESEEQFNEEDWIKVIGRVSGNGRRGRIIGTDGSHHFSVVKFSDGTSASYHNSDLEHSDEPDEGEDEMYECNLCGDKVYVGDIRDHLIQHSSAYASSDGDPMEHFTLAESTPKSLADRLLAEAGTPRDLARRIERLGSQFSRKPHQWEDIVKVRIPRHELAGLHMIPASELFADEGGDEAPPEAHFSSPPDRYFVLERKGLLYLVDTGGYDYARYIMELCSLGDDPVDPDGRITEAVGLKRN